VFEILVTRGAEGELRNLTARTRKTIVEAIERQLEAEPDVPTRNRKVLAALRPPWTGLDPVWELRVGDFRVFYDVDAEESRVYVRAIRRKPPHRTTEEIL
jgi:mRNA-degrading endonuclease RelE of RelBE toxin-antitoxin system